MQKELHTKIRKKLEKKHSKNQKLVEELITLKQTKKLITTMAMNLCVKKLGVATYGGEFLKSVLLFEKTASNLLGFF